MKKSFLLSNELCKQLEDFSQGNQDELRNLLLAGFAILLHRTQEQTEVRIATPPLPLKAHWVSNQQQWQIAFSKELTIGQLLDDLQNASAIHQTSFANSYGIYYSYNSPDNSNAYPPNCLRLSILLHNATLQGDFTCEGGVFSECDIELLASRYPVILEGMLKGTNQICSELSLLTSAEKQHLLEWNQNKVEYPKDACLHTLIEMQVERTPDAVAVSYQGYDVTYRELNAQANQIAHYLIQKKVGPGSLVGLYTDPSPRMLSAMLGILKTGAAYVCLDPVYPAHKLKFIAEECELSFLLTTSRLEKAFPVPGKPTLLLDDHRLIKGQPKTNPSLRLSSDSPVFIVYTSGSAGVPKGVIHAHRNVISRFYSTWALAPTVEEEVYSQTSPLSSIDLIDEIYPPLMRGYRVQMLDMETVRDPHLLVEALEVGRVTRMILVPSLLRTILSLDISIAHVLHALKVVLIGGEPLTYALADLFYQKLPHAQLINFYGLTEGDGAFYPVPPNQKISFAPPIGRPIANTRIYILDPNMEPVPVGMSGEIYIANAGMARGYFKRPNLDSQRFLSNPFSDSSKTRLYKTGDRGRFLPDGIIEYLGRIDRMVKIRGFRVELGEVEAAINTHPEVHECIVLTRQDNNKLEQTLTHSPRLVGYVVLKNLQRISSQVLKTYLRDRLPDYALPSTIVILESFPLSPTGKIDISALPVPEQVSRALDEKYVRPRDPLEIQLTHMWERILRISPIGIYDNFFDIGGDSLNAVDLFLQIEKDLQKDLPISVLMQAPTIAELAVLIRQDTSSYSWSSLVPIQPFGTRLPLFCIHANGGVIVYKHFVHYLGPNQPIFGLQARGLLGTKDAPHKDLRQMAADYIQEMRTVQPTGPYQLCAFSMGGVVAFEIACQLRAAGEEVAFLGLFDTYSPGYLKQISGPNLVQYKLSVHRGALSRSELPQKLHYLRRRLRHRLFVIQSSLFGRIFVALRLPMPHRIRYDYVRQINEEAAEKYVPGKYPGTLTIFRANIQPEGIVPDPSLGWDGHAERIELVDVVGTHDSIMKKPDLGGLLKHVQSYLAESFDLPVELRESVLTQ
jgi:amino acid adenylation domain-containing protein